MTGDEDWLKRHRPRRYWFRLMSAERRAAREVAAKAERLAALPQPVRYAPEPEKPVEPVDVEDAAKDTKRLMRRIWEGQGKVCFLCAKPLAFDAVTADHVTPRAQGGPNALNRLAACSKCNGRKNCRMPFACELMWLDHINLTVVKRGVRKRASPKRANKRSATMKEASNSRRAGAGAPNAYRDSLSA